MRTFCTTFGRPQQVRKATAAHAFRTCLIYQEPDTAFAKLRKLHLIIIDLLRENSHMGVPGPVLRISPHSVVTLKNVTVHSSVKELQGILNLHRRKVVVILADAPVEAVTILVPIYLRFHTRAGAI